MGEPEYDPQAEANGAKLHAYLELKCVLVAKETEDSESGLREAGQIKQDVDVVIGLMQKALNDLTSDAFGFLGYHVLPHDAPLPDDTVLVSSFDPDRDDEHPPQP